MIYQELIMPQGNPAANTAAFAVAMFTLLFVNFKDALFAVEATTNPETIVLVNMLYDAIDQEVVFHFPIVEANVIENYYTRLYAEGLPILQQMDRLVGISPANMRRLTNIEHMQVIHLMLTQVYTTLVEYSNIFIVLIIKGDNLFASQMTDILNISESFYQIIKFICRDLIMIIRIVENQLGQFNINRLGITIVPNYPFFEI